MIYITYADIFGTTIFQYQIDTLIDITRGDHPHYVRNRAHAIILLFVDHRTFKDVANICRVHVNTIRNWAKRWIEYGLDGIYNLPGCGAKPIFTEEEELTVLECARETPRSLRAVADEVERRTGKKASCDTIKTILKKYGKSLKRQRKITKGKPDQEEYEKGKSDIEELKQLESDGEFQLFYFDASGFNLTPEVPYAWQDIGRTGTIGIQTSKSERINVLGFMGSDGNSLVSFEHEGSVNSNVIINVMEEFCDNLTEPAVVILDNASVHTSKAVREKLKEWDACGLTLYFIQPYSPQLNIIEIMWRKIKYEWMPNSAYSGFNALKVALREILNSFGTTYTIQFS